MIVFQVSLNFDPVSKVLKIRRAIYILMKIITIMKIMKINLRKIQVTMKTFAPLFFIHVNLSLQRKKRVVMKAMRKKLPILNILILQLSIYSIAV